MFSYDANGNRSSLSGVEGTAIEVTTLYSILENSNRLTKVDTVDYMYDENGNITNDGDHSYTYDARNRLTDVDGTNSYLFNANNMRVKNYPKQNNALWLG